MGAEQRLLGVMSERKNILTLDGGGVRGALTAGLLESVERVLAERSGRGAAFRLCDHFDLIAGTSTGSIIATALSLGYSAAEVTELYRSLAPRVFAGTRLNPLRARFDARRLRRVLGEHLGERTLESHDLRTNLLICAKRMDTCSPWFITNAPGGRFWDGDPDDRDVEPNRRYRLVDVVQASTAAPFFFAFSRIRISSDQTGMFMDGAVSPYNNPALAAFLVATIPAYGINWPLGESNLSLVSLGTGSRSETVGPLFRFKPSFLQAVEALQAIPFDTSEQAVTLLQALSEPARPVRINSELGDMSGVRLTPDPMLHFQRIEIPLQQRSMEEVLGEAWSASALKRLSSMTNAGNVSALIDLGRRAGEQLVDAKALGLEDPVATGGPSP